MSRKQKHSSSSKPLIDVIITTGGRFDLLSKCLDALYLEAENTPLSIFIIDNASPAEEYRMNSEMFSRREGSAICEFRVKHLQQHLGFPASNNEGARMGSAPIILFLNDDVELHEGALDKIVRTLDDPAIGVVGIKLLFPPNSTSPIRPAGKVQHVGVSMNIRGEPNHPLIGWNPANAKTNKSRDVFAVTGAALAIRRQLFNKIGGFNVVYGDGTWEDMEICVMARQNGQRVFVNTDACAYHYTGATQEKNNRGFPIKINQMMFQSRWASSGQLFWDDWVYY